MVKFFMSNSPVALAAIAPTVTVEAEYGDVVVEGSKATLAHHGPRAGNPAPCSGLWDLSHIACGEDVVVGLSHIDLDTVGGCMAVLKEPLASSFWDVAAFVDTRGVHRLAEANASASDLARLHAWWAWNEVHKLYAPRDGSCLDVTDRIHEAIEIVKRILADDAGLLDAGREFAAKEAELNRSTYRGTFGSDLFIVRESGQFVNHLYVNEFTGLPARAVVAFNPEKGIVTLSFCDISALPTGQTAVSILQSFFGPLAGGHACIGGSPRGEVVSRETFAKFLEHLQQVFTA